MANPPIALDAPPRVDYTGKKIDRWKVLAFAGRRIIGKKRPEKVIYWKCRCACGKIVTMQQKQLLHGVKCKRCVAKKGSRKHGGSGNPVCKAWNRIRCSYPESTYPEWMVTEGGKGYRIFARYVGARPSEHHQITRKNPKKGWIPGNVHWILRRPKLYRYEGEDYTIGELAFIANVKPGTMWCRLQSLDPVDAVRCQVS